MSTTTFQPLATHPTGITCTNTAGTYGCVWGTDNGDGGTDDLTTLAVGSSFFPFGTAEQHPIANDPNANLLFTVAGGGDYSASEAAIGGGADPIAAATITGIKLGTTNLGTAIESLSGRIDGTQPITFSYSCDGTSTTGSGCPSPGTAPLDTVALLVQTSQMARGHFAQPPTEKKFGIGECLDQSNDPAHQIIFDTTSIAALLNSGTTTSATADGGTALQAGGSSLFALVRIKAKINVTSATMPEVFAAGKGTLGIVDLP